MKTKGIVITAVIVVFSIFLSQWYQFKEIIKNDNYDCVGSWAETEQNYLEDVETIDEAEQVLSEKLQAFNMNTGEVKSADITLVNGKTVNVWMMNGVAIENGGNRFYVREGCQ